MSSASAGEGELRRAIVEDDLIDCMVALPAKLFYSTQIPVSLWFIARDKADPRFRTRRGETLFIDARELGSMVDRIHRELTADDVDRIVRTYHVWRGKSAAADYADVPGFCRSVPLAELMTNECTLVPGHYVGPRPDADAAPTSPCASPRSPARSRSTSTAPPSSRRRSVGSWRGSRDERYPPLAGALA
jgi:type I restriction enzyme M protein